jgi:hypothetical protein
MEANPVPLAFTTGLLSFLLGFVWSVVLLVRTFSGAVTATEVVASTLLLVGGGIVLLLAIVLDVLFSFANTRNGGLANPMHLDNANWTSGRATTRPVIDPASTDRAV